MDRFFPNYAAWKVTNQSEKLDFIVPKSIKIVKSIEAGYLQLCIMARNCTLWEIQK